MKLNLFNTLVLASTAAASSCTLIDGMYYCNEVSQIQYEGIGFSGSYNKVTAMDSSSGSCSSSAYSFSGSLSPIDEEISLHFRGPLHLAQFAAYSLSSGSSTKREAGVAHHVHKRAPKPAYVTQVVQETYFVTVDGDGNLVTSSAAATVAASSAAASTVTASSKAASSSASSEAASSSASSEAASSSSATKTTSSGGAALNNYNYNGLADSSTTGSSTISSSSAAAATGTVSSSGDWTRIGYYDASSGTSSGLTFMNNLGGSGSGVFDYSFGNSLSYAASDGTSCASSAETLDSVTIPSNSEIIIFTDTECSGDDCGFYREGIPAYHGFDGSDKIFLIEFEMPTEDSVSSSTYNYDMPAIWALNAQIPRTLQYGNSECSCWSTGCGELDLFEVLSAGNKYCTTTLHTKQDGSGAGSSDYFARPLDGTIKAAVIFADGKVTITTLDSSVDFDSSLDDDTINGWISATSGSSSTVQL